MTNESGFLETNGARIHYEVDGPADPPSPSSMPASPTCACGTPEAAALRDEYRVIRYDTRGYGLTVTDAVGFSNRADLAALLDHLGEESAHVVGLSRGGMIALDFSPRVSPSGCARSPSPPAASAATSRRPEDRRDVWEAPDAMLTAAPNWEGLGRVGGRLLGRRPRPTGRTACPTCALASTDWVLANYRAEKEEGQPTPLDPPAEQRLADLRMPLLVMYGTLDEPATSESMRHLAASVPGARLEAFESSPHAQPRASGAVHRAAAGAHLRAVAFVIGRSRYPAATRELAHLPPRVRGGGDWRVRCVPRQPGRGRRVPTPLPHCGHSSRARPWLRSAIPETARLR